MTKTVSKFSTLRTVALSASLAAALIASPVYAKDLKVAVGDGGGSAQEAMGLKFAELLKEKTDGKFTAKLFVNGQLGSEQTTVNDVALGTLDMSILASNNLAPFAPPLGILSLPYAFENIDQAVTITTGEVGKGLKEETLKLANVRILAWTYAGFRMLTNSEKPVTSLADLEGLKVRVPKSDILIDTYKALGASPSPVAWAETFTALQQGVVEGQETPYAAIYSMKFGEVQKYLSETHYIFGLEPLIVSEELFQKQTPEVQKAMLEAGKEASEYSLAWIKEKEEGIKKSLVADYGMEISTITDEAEWAKKAQADVWPKYMEQVGGKDAVNTFLKALGRDEI